MKPPLGSHVLPPVYPPLHQSPQLTHYYETPLVFWAKKNVFGPTLPETPTTRLGLSNLPSAVARMCILGFCGVQDP